MDRLAAFLIAISLGSALGACADRPLQASYYEMAEAGWDADSCYTFHFTPSAEEGADVYFYIQHNNLYPNANLYLFIRLDSPQGQKRFDTINYPVASPSGEWYGRGLGEDKALLLPYLRNVEMSTKGEYTISVKQGMRYDILPGIQEVGLQVYPHKTDSHGQE